MSFLSQLLFPHLIFHVVLELDVFNTHFLIYLALNHGFSLEFYWEALIFFSFLIFLALTGILKGKKKLNSQFFQLIYKNIINEPTCYFLSDN